MEEGVKRQLNGQKIPKGNFGYFDPELIITKQKLRGRY